MREELLATVNDEHATVEAFASLLAYEEKALTTPQPLDMLPGIVEKKSELIDRLAQLERTRDAQLSALGFPAGKKGMDQAAERDARLAGRWQLLLQATERARQANATNGMLIGSGWTTTIARSRCCARRPRRPASTGRTDACRR
jgi:flagella synthesis protein FlgN